MGTTAFEPSRRASQTMARIREEGRSGGMATPSFSSFFRQISACRRSASASSRKERALSGSFSWRASPS